MNFRPLSILPAALLLCAGAALAAETTAAAQLQHWSAQAGAPGNASMGQAFFNARHGGEWSCASCHGMPPTAQGKHANTGKVMTQRHLLREVWGPASVESNHYLRVYVGHLRQKLEDDATQPKYLLTETGVGYRFQP